MPRVKKLTVKVFDDPECPVDATCAAVDADGTAYWFNGDPEEVVVTGTNLWDTRGEWMAISGFFDSADWENSKIINPHWKGKKLTQDVFDDRLASGLECGFDPMCAVVQPDGSAFFCATSDLEMVDEFEKGWGLTKKAALRLKDVSRDAVWREIGKGYDASDWQHSMVLRPTDGSTVSSVTDPNPIWVSEIEIEMPSEDEKPITGVPDSGLPDSGKRESFGTGAVRDDAVDKPRPDLISPFFLERLGEHMRKGAIKYSANNWAKGIPNSRCWASLQRHLMKFAQGLNDEDHLAAAAFNLMAIIHNEEVAKRGIKLRDKEGLVDMPIYGQQA